ncbi:uncharacterized protein LOC116299185 [Actinia tenebrosa]|uniref:Uncharacterized protein LOC116299185 n=1 Tax=Actinia tenebrosa TaxID=6105 RepID=A0A6P8I6S9_ACTTE|nr:uncharacterized protein LOC116299185 [Actinia tenebrosa]
MHSAEINVQDLHLINEEDIEVVYQKHKDFEPENNRCNIFIAIFTTAYGRLEFHRVIHELGPRALYLDTDSIVFVKNLDNNVEYEPGTSDYLGDLTNELQPNQHIGRFFCAGPKNYAYCTNDGATVVKVRGFQLNHRNSQLINLESMKALIEDYERGGTIQVVNENKITRQPITRKIANKREEKTYRVVFDKRILIDGGKDTIPYGYDWSPPDIEREKRKHAPHVDINLLPLFSVHSDLELERS